MYVFSVLSVLFAVLAFYLKWIIGKHYAKDSFTLSQLLFWPIRIKYWVPRHGCAFMGHETYHRKQLAGELSVPKKAYEGDSHIVSLVFQPAIVEIPKHAAEDLKDKLTKNNPDLSVFVELPLEKTESGKLREAAVPQSYPQLPLTTDRTYLEAEILAPGCKVTGNECQKSHLHAEKIAFRWNLLFDVSGTHDVLVVVRILTMKPHEELRREVGTIQRKIKVTRLFSLTKRQLLISAFLSLVVSLLLAIVQLLKIVGYLK